MTGLTEPTPLAAARGLNREVVAMVSVNTHDKATAHHSAYQIRINGMASHVEHVEDKCIEAESSMNCVDKAQ